MFFLLLPMLILLSFEPCQAVQTTILARAILVENVIFQLLQIFLDIILDIFQGKLYLC